MSPAKGGQTATIRSGRAGWLRDARGYPSAAHEGNTTHPPFRETRHHVRHPHAALAGLLEFSHWRHQARGLLKTLVAGAQFERDLVAGLAFQARLVVEQIHLRGPTLHPKQDDALRLRREMRCLGTQRILPHVRCGLLRSHRSHCDRAEASPDGPQKVAPGRWKRLNRMEHGSPPVEKLARDENCLTVACPSLQQRIRLPAKLRHVSLKTRDELPRLLPVALFGGAIQRCQDDLGNATVIIQAESFMVTSARARAASLMAGEFNRYNVCVGTTVWARVPTTWSGSAKSNRFRISTSVNWPPRIIG